MKKIFNINKNFIVLGIFVYIIFNIVNFFINNSIETVALEYSNLEQKVRKKGVIIREETVLKSNISGNVTYNYNEGDRVKKGDIVSTVYNKKIDENIEDQINELDKDISEIKEGSNSIVYGDIKKINDDIEKITQDIRTDINKGELVAIQDKETEMIKLIEKKNKILNDGLLSKNLENKEIEKESLENKVEENSEQVASSISGIISYVIDGQEEKFNYSNMKNIKIEDIEKAENKSKNIKVNSTVKKDEEILKVVNNHKFYVAFSLDDEEMNNLEDKKSIILRYNDKEVEAKINFTQKVDKDKNLVIFESGQQNEEFCNTRTGEFDIIYKKIEGLKIPKESTLEKDNVQGVYVITETGNTEFTELKGVSGEDEDFIIVNYYKNKLEGIDTVDIHDQIVLNPNKVREGKRIK